jgi:CBS domain-containing protein
VVVVVRCLSISIFVRAGPPRFIARLFSNGPRDFDVTRDDENPRVKDSSNVIPIIITTFTLLLLPYLNTTTMRVAGFMIPAHRVATAFPSDTLKDAMEDMLAKKIGCLVVLMKENESDQEHVPVGILTKTDFMKAYMKEMPLTTSVRDIMSTKLVTVRDNINRDQAGRVFEEHKNHHAIVVDGNGKFQGIISAWDIVAECVKDDRAWPWNRSEDGKFHKPNETQAQTSPRTTAEHPPGSPRGFRESHAFLDYVDSVRDLPFMDD